MSAVSILYAPNDEALGDKIAAALANAGLPSSRPSDGDASLKDGAAIIVWTEAAAKLAQLHEQALLAMSRGALVPVAVSGVTPPEAFETLPPVDLSGWTGSSDDPRWRFVLEEIQLTNKRLELRDGAPWRASENGSNPSTDEMPDALAIEARVGRALSEHTPSPAPPGRGSSRRRFSAKEVAIGASAGLVVMTVATALLGPVLLPAPNATGPVAAAPDNDAVSSHVPDPSEENSSALASLSVSASVSGLDTSNPHTDNIEASAPTRESAASDKDTIKDLIAAANSETNDDALAVAAVSPEAATGQALVGDAFKFSTFKDCPQCPEMASLPAGSFQMGAAPGETARTKSERPQQQVTLGKGFALGTREVTYAQWDACLADGGCTTAPPDHGWGRGQRPVVSVSYEDAQAYVAWLSKKTGQSYRLPSEAEWEYAARAGSQSAFATGAGISTAQSNYNGQFPYRGPKETFRERTVETASFPANAFGLFDMHGNAWEWTADCWKASHASAPADGAPVSSGDCGKRVLKGGAWNTGAWRLRSAHRIGKAKTAREFDNGFRVARDLG